MSTLEISQLLGNYGEFVGAIAIVVTLIYLAVQIRQNTASSQAASRDWVSRSTIDLQVALFKDNETALTFQTGLANPDGLGESAWRFELMIYAVFENFDAAFAQWKRGVFSDEDWEKMRITIGQMIGQSGAQRSWEAGLKRLMSQPFQDYVEELGTGLAVVNVADYGPPSNPESA